MEVEHSRLNNLFHLDNFRLDNLCVVGVGLIGGSFALGLKNAGFTGRITGVFRDAKKAQQAIALGVVDDATTDLASAAAKADLIMLTVPMLSMRDQLECIAPVVQSHTIITDGGSVKQPFIGDAVATLPYLNRVVPGHPIAGKEQSGLDAIDPELYQQHRVLLTPLSQTDADATKCVRALWEMVGGEVEELQPDHHDDVLALTSHLPHVLAFSLVDMLAARQELEEVFRYSAGGFRDFTRIASGDPVMWRDICLTNKAPLLKAIEELEGHLAGVKQAMRNDNADELETVFRRARDTRNKHIVHKNKMPSA